MNSVLTIVSVGPGSPSLMTLETSELLPKSDRIFLRTDHHPVADWIRSHGRGFSSFDGLYDTCEDFDRLYEDMARILLDELNKGSLIYAVPDPLTDRSVDRLFDLCTVSSDRIRVLPGVSAADAFLASARSALRGSGVRTVSAASLPDSAFDPDQPLLIMELDTASQAGDVKIFLSELLDDESPVWFLQGHDGKNTLCERISLFELDRRSFYDHRSALFLPGFDIDHRSRYTLRDLERIMELLRAPDGCPWDSIQTHDSLKQYMVEEAWEAVNAIDAEDYDHLADELGDVLLQIVFHASIGRSFDEFTLTDVTTHICRKMIDRHPHVFGSEHFDRPEQVSDRWETIKRRETGSKTVAESLDDVSPGLPSLKYAAKVQKKAMQLEGFRRDIALIQHEISQLSLRLLNQDHSMNDQILGTLLMRCTELSHRCGMDAEVLLHEAVDRYKCAFRAMASEAEKQGKKPESLTFRDECVYLEHVEGRK